MANFRLERLFVMLDEPVPGLDHMKAIDAVEFAWHNSDQHAEGLGVTPLGAFTFAPFEQPEWHDASEGLMTVRALRSVYADWIAKGANPFRYKDDVLALLSRYRIERSSITICAGFDIRGGALQRPVRGQSQSNDS